MRTDRYCGTIIAKNQHDHWVIKFQDQTWGIDFGADNEKLNFGDVVKFETTVSDAGFRTFKLIENVTAKKREKVSKRELVVIDGIHKDTGLVDIYLPSRDEHDVAFVGNWAWAGVKIEGLDLNSCAVKDKLLVEIETFEKKRTIKFIKNASRDIGEYTNTVVGRLRITADGLCSVNAIVGGKVFKDVDLGDYKDISRLGDLVEVCVHYDEKNEPVKCVVVKNTSAIARQPIENNKQKRL